MKEKLNNAILPKGKLFSSMILQAGVCGYPEKSQNILVPEESLYEFAKEFVGIPLTIDHIDGDNVAGEMRVGYVARTKVEDSKIYADYIVYDVEAIRLLQDGYSVSTSYEAIESDEISDTYNGVSYDGKILKIKAFHLAIVEKPRYNEIKVFQNSSPKTNSLNKFKLISNNKMGIFKKKNNSKAYANVDGENISLSDLIEAYEEMKEAEEIMGEDDEVEVGGEKIKVSELVNAYKKMSNKKSNNEKDEGSGDKEKKMDNEKSEEKEEKKDNEKDEEKKDNKRMNNSLDSIRDLIASEIKKSLNQIEQKKEKQDRPLSDLRYDNSESKIEKTFLKSNIELGKAIA